MLDDRGDLKIADFGLARPAVAQGHKYSLTAPSQSYRAPELLFSCREYDGAAVDVWSAGCVFAELLGALSHGFYVACCCLVPVARCCACCVLLPCA